ncbi:MAG: hypothetical protein ACRCTW_05795 [Lactococcus garvieae]
MENKELKRALTVSVKIITYPIFFIIAVVVILCTYNAFNDSRVIVYADGTTRYPVEIYYRNTSTNTEEHSGLKDGYLYVNPHKQGCFVSDKDHLNSNGLMNSSDVKCIADRIDGDQSSSDGVEYKSIKMQVNGKSISGYYLSRLSLKSGVLYNTYNSYKSKNWFFLSLEYMVDVYKAVKEVISNGL